MNGVIIIFYRQHNVGSEFLVVKNAKTGNVGFVSGGQEGEESPEETAQREIKEEIGLESKQYMLIPTNVRHEFIFGSNKSERAGQQGSYQIFLVDGVSSDDIPYTNELKSIAWKSKEDVLKELSFDDLRGVFIEVLEQIEI